MSGEVVTWCHGKICECDPLPGPVWAKIKVRELESPITVHIADRIIILGGPRGPRVAGLFGTGTRTLKLDDKVVFIPNIVDSEMRTTQWGYEDDYDKAVLDSPAAEYRCVVSYRYAGARFFEPEVVKWQGKLSEITEFAQRSAMEYYDMENHDHNINMCGYTYGVRWEICQDDAGVWRRCECPDEYKQHAASIRDL